MKISKPQDLVKLIDEVQVNQLPMLSKDNFQANCVRANLLPSKQGKFEATLVFLDSSSYLCRIRSSEDIWDSNTFKKEYHRGSKLTGIVDTSATGGGDAFRVIEEIFFIFERDGYPGDRVSINFKLKSYGTVWAILEDGK